MIKGIVAKPIIVGVYFLTNGDIFIVDAELLTIFWAPDVTKCIALPGMRTLANVCQAKQSKPSKNTVALSDPLL